jgi:hypothetical protein
MKDHIDTGDRAATHRGVAQVAPLEFDRTLECREIRLIAGAEIVHHPDHVSERHQPPNEMRPDETGSPGHQTL